MTAQSGEGAIGRYGRWLTVAEVAEVLRRSARTIRRWCDTGFLVGAKQVGRAWLIPESAIEALLQPVTNEPTAA